MEWDERLNTAAHALAQGLGSLAVSVCVPAYLASVPPHTQLNIVHSIILPLLRERGMPLVWSSEQLAMGSFCQPVIERDSTSFPSSYPALCQAVLPQLSPATFTTKWLEQAYSLPTVLSMSLAALSWHRSVLLHDPEAFASRWLKEWKGEELMVVDYRERQVLCIQSCIIFSLIPAALKASLLNEYYTCTPHLPENWPI